MNCEKCGKLMLEKVNKSNGQKFWACPGYPACRNTKPFEVDPTAIKPEITQPQASKREYKLTEENIRSNALQCGVMYATGSGLKSTPDQIVKFAQMFEPYIRNG